MSMESISEQSLKFAILTVSDTRTEHDDKGGKCVLKWTEDNGHRCVASAIVKDDAEQIQGKIIEWTERKDVDVIITTGGTGISKRDVTLEALLPLFHKTITGFGEIFRFLSFSEDIGTRAMASRAEAGVIGNILVFSVPGSVGAINLAMPRLILPEVGHLLYEIRK